MLKHYSSEDNSTSIKPKQWERDIQGGNQCNVCGSNDPCGNIMNCGWWTS